MATAVLQRAQRIVSVGIDTELVWLRDAVLRSAGFNVLSTANEQTALTEIRQHKCHVLLLYYKLPSDLVARLVKAFRQRCPNGRIVVVSNRAMDKPDFADCLLYNLDGPDDLIAAVRSS